MPYEITEHKTYLRAVIGQSAPIDEFVRLYKELQTLGTVRGLTRALVIVTPNDEVPGYDRLTMYGQAGFIEGFRLAVVCATWRLYQTCSKAERGATQAGIQMRTFLQEMEGVTWLNGR